MGKTEYAQIVRGFTVPGQKDHKLQPENGEEFKETLKFSLRCAFKDFNFRTLTKIDKKYVPPKIETGESQTITDHLVRCLDRQGFLERFAVYFQTPAPADKDSFDHWHNGTCELFLKTLRETGIYVEIRYGKAQKIVNMMLKHLYCLEGAKERDAYFTFCHLTLDNYTLEWFKREVPPKQRIDSWSNLVYQKPAHSKQDYLFYQDSIRDWFEKNAGNKEFRYLGLTPFQAEFYIWQEIQLSLAAEALYGQAVGREDAIKKAQTQWGLRWTEAQEEDINEKFDRCKAEFRKQPLEDKLKYLVERVHWLDEFYSKMRGDK